jgi:hypothetical protein
MVVRLNKPPQGVIWRIPTLPSHHPGIPPDDSRQEPNISRFIDCSEVQMALDNNGEVTARRPLQPCFELWEDAIAMAEFDASRLWGDYGCDEERDCWWATDTRGRKYRFLIEQVRPTDIAA